MPRQILRALLVFPIPYIPLRDIIRDTNKRFFVLVEKPSIGLLTTAIGVSIARFLSPSQASWGANFIDSYVNYTLKDVVANGVALQSDLSKFRKYLVNYLYNIGFYAVGTMSTAKVWGNVSHVLLFPSSAGAADIDGASYAIGLVSFAVMWGLFSQLVNTTILPPVLFNRFMQKEDMDMADKSKQPDSDVVYKSYLDRLKHLEQNPTSENKKAARYLRFRYMWVKWRRDGLKPNDLNPFTGATVKKRYQPLSKRGYWFRKTAVFATITTAMIVGYFAARNYAVGTSPTDPGVFTNYVQTHISQIHDSDLNTAATAVENETPADLTE